MKSDRKSDRAPEDRALTEAFASLRRDVESRPVPDFDRMIARARDEAARIPDLRVVPGGRPNVDERMASAQRGAWRRGVWASLATAAAVAAVAVFSFGPDRADAEFERLVADYAADASLGAWRSPTDALLRTPGVSLGAVPSIGTVPRRAAGGGPR